MANKPLNLIKLGVFVLGGLLFLIVLLFMIGQNENMFGSNYMLRTQVDNAAGLRAGNNVRYSGIEVGTVKKVIILNDTLIEISMVLDNNMKQVIRKNAIVTLGTDGLIGNKVVNIEPGAGMADLAVENDLLLYRMAINTETMLRTLSASNKNIEDITKGLKIAVTRINESEGLWKLLNDTMLAVGLRKSALNLQKATANAELMTKDMLIVIDDVKNGKGTVGTLLRDTGIAYNLNATIIQLQKVADEADKLAGDLDLVVKNINHEIQDGTGPMHAILKDTSMVNKLNMTLDNVEKGTAAFNENMEAAKHNFLFKGYFKKQEKEKAKQQKQLDQQKQEQTPK
jgi:phospholipid/cholesterol/gamma-HCH transport system substrate-binding protein